MSAPMPAGRLAPDSLAPTADVEAVNAPGRRSLYKKREPIYPKQVRGRFRTIKWAAMAALLAIYYVTPWLRWDRGPGAPDQAVLLDLPARRFYVFFIEIWPQEVYYLTGLLILAAVGLFLATSVAGRVWCGYACPQTVWTDLFIAVERLFEGDRGARIRLAKAPWSAAKLARRIGKHATWLLVAMATGGAWVFYFADAPTLLRDLVTLQAPQVAYVFVGLLTATTYTLGGFAREQVCTYMCPWPRIQGAMLDEESFVVSYRRDRGEPRGPHRKNESWESRGHCIDCKQCVAACPMGIDIRDGMQLECITCALCIDACDEVMDKIGLPRGLIAYDTEANMQRRARGEALRFRAVRPRTVAYAAILALVAAAMAIAFAVRSDLDVNVLRDRNPLFVMLADGSVRNAYTVKILNKAHAERRLALSVEGLPGASVRVVGADDDTGDGTELAVPADRLRSFRVLLAAPRAALDAESTPVRFVARDLAGGLAASHASQFLGPKP